MALGEELQRIAERAAGYAAPGEALAGVVAAEPGAGRRVYLCAFASGESRAWLALDDSGEAVADRRLVRDAVSIAALCEVAAETAGGGDLAELRSQLVALRVRESPPGIEEAEDAALALERTVGAEPRLATPRYLDEVGAATRRLEHALGDGAASPFAAAMREAMGAVESLAEEVERGYKAELR